MSTGRQVAVSGEQNMITELPPLLMLLVQVWSQFVVAHPVTSVLLYTGLLLWLITRL